MRIIFKWIFASGILLTCMPLLSPSQSYTPAKPYGDNKLVHDFICSEVVYPEQALEQGQEGTVTLRFIVEEDGTVTDIQIWESVSPEIDREAIRVFRLLQWEPAIRLGNPVASEEEYSMKFNISKYNRHCKSRGYEKTEYPYLPVDSSLTVYPLTRLDKAPQPIFQELNMNLGRFITQNLIYPEAAYKQNIAGIVELSFVVEIHGRVSNILVDKPLGGGCTEEAVRILKLIKWMPGIKNETAVRSRIPMAITFDLPDESDTRVFDNNQAGTL